MEEAAFSRLSNFELLKIYLSPDATARERELISDLIIDRREEREALSREARQEALLDAGPILAEYRHLKGEM
jgi:hypothetical protein